MSERNDASYIADDDALVGDENQTPGNDGKEKAGDLSDSAKQVEAIQQLEQENASLKDQFLRQRAEFENYRRRVAKEKDDLQEYASSEVVKPLLAIVDDFERALAVECSDANYAKGMDLIYQRLLDSLRKLGVEKMEVVGTVFDPNLHHAIDMVKTAQAPDNTVLDVYQSGYLFKGKLLRPAVVKVAVEPDA